MARWMPYPCPMDYVMDRFNFRRVMAFCGRAMSTNKQTKTTEHDRSRYKVIIINSYTRQTVSDYLWYSAASPCPLSDMIMINQLTMNLQRKIAFAQIIM